MEPLDIPLLVQRELELSMPSADQTRWHENCSVGLGVLNAYLSMSSVEVLRHQRVLTPRERDVALRVARGLSNKEVARELGLSSGTVKLHLHRIFQKLGVKGRSSLRGHERLLAAE